MVMHMYIKLANTFGNWLYMRNESVSTIKLHPTQHSLGHFRGGVDRQKLDRY